MRHDWSFLDLKEDTLSSPLFTTSDSLNRISQYVYGTSSQVLYPQKELVSRIIWCNSYYEKIYWLGEDFSFLPIPIKSASLFSCTQDDWDVCCANITHLFLQRSQYQYFKESVKILKESPSLFHILHYKSISWFFQVITDFISQ